MKLFHRMAMAAGVFCAPSLAAAEYYNYGAPATLPAPAYQVRALAYNPTEERLMVPEPTPVPTQAQDAYAPNAAHYDNALSGNALGGNGGCTSCNGGGEWAGDGYDGGCGGGDCCGCGPSWYGSFAGLYMQRNRPNPYQVSFDTLNPVGELLLNTSSLNEWQPGFEVRVGKYLGCSSAVEVGYWTLDNFGGSACAYDPAGPGGLNTPFDFRSLNFNGVPVTDLYDGAEIHRLSRSDEFHNLEINFLNFPMSCNPCSRMQASWLAGFRYMNFRESWQLASSYNSPDFGVDPAYEAYWNIRTQNNLYGFQLGGRGSYCVTQHLSVYAAPRAGVFYNDMSQHTWIVDGNNVSALDCGSNRNIFSIMAQLDVGLNYQVTPCVGIYGGYRIMALSGIALADQQVPFLQDDRFGISDIDHNSNLVLSGFMGGVTVTF
jgi:hypothetical protein